MLRGRSAHLQLHIDLPTLLKLGDNPGHLEGYGPVPAALARLIAATSRTIQLVTTDPDTGRCLHIGAVQRHDPPDSMSDVVHAQHQICRFPGCRCAAVRCDLDHQEEYPAGVTCPCNLAPHCRTHHNLKTHGGWRVRPADPANPQGDLIWTSPHGRRYTDHAEPPILDPHDTDPLRSTGTGTGTGTGTAAGHRGFGLDQDEPPPF